MAWSSPKELFKIERNEQTNNALVQLINTFLNNSLHKFRVTVSNISIHNNIDIFRGYLSIFFIKDQRQ